MEDPFKNPQKPKSKLEIKEGEPKVHTVYAYIKIGWTDAHLNRNDGVMGIYLDKEQPMELAHLEDMFAEEEKIIIPMHVYEREEDLPESIRKGIITSFLYERLPMQVLEKEEGVVYAVMPNTDSTEGSGYSYIWTLVTDPILANKMAMGNGPSGSNAEVVAIPLNKSLEKSGRGMYEVTIRRDKKGGLKDDLYV